MFSDILSRREKTFLYTLCLIWLASGIVFCAWWFEPRHVGFLLGFLLTSFVVLWPIIVFGYSLFFLVRMKKINGCPIPSGLRVAIVVTKAPSEPFSVLKSTLGGALLQKYPHDTWVADEHPSAEAIGWYELNGIRVSCRKDDPSYHNDDWPRRKKCKEGNLAYFYEKYGYENYDIVVQMDVDHQPQEGYLEEMLRPFMDESIGYVAAPSICNMNADKSWASRARTQAEAIFHGPMQAGQNGLWVPICIGSHYAVRTKALKEIGGIGPELAEDYATTMMFNASNWKGVCVNSAKANGEGPNSFMDLVVQDYQWARSLTVLFLTLYPKLWKKFDWRQRIHFTFTQLWYALSSFAWLAGLVMIVTALLSGHTPVIVSFTNFLKFAFIPYVLAFIIFGIIQSKGHLRPEHTNFIGWESILFELARWPWIFIACVDGAVSVITSKKNIITVTSKSKASSDEVPIKIIAPYLLTTVILMLAVIFKKNTPLTTGYEIFALVIGSFYLALSLVVLVLHIKEVEHPNKAKLVARHISHFVVSIGLVSIMIMLMFGIKFYQTLSTTWVDAYTQTAPLVVKTDEQTVATSSQGQIASEYQVKDGDTFKSISLKYYGNEMDWKYMKRQKSGNPDLIFPGETISIPETN